MTELTTMNERKRVGHVGAVVADNIQRLREEKNLSRPDLARRINELHQEDRHAGKGWELSRSKINALAITRIENGERRVDVDDLVLIDIAGETATLETLCHHKTSWHTQSSHCHPTWSWDGQRILYASDHGGRVQLYMLEL